MHAILFRNAKIAVSIIDYFQLIRTKNYFFALIYPAKNINRLFLINSASLH